MDDIPIFAFPSHLRDHIFPTPHILIIMAKTLGTNPHSQDPPPRRSNRNAPRTSPVGKKAPGRKGTVAARKATLSTLSTRRNDKTTLSTRKKDKTNTSARANTAPHDSDSESSNFSGQRKAPPELIAPAQAVEPRSMPTRKTAAARKTPPPLQQPPFIPLAEGPAYPVRATRTPAPEPPKLLNIPNTFQPFEEDDDLGIADDIASRVCRVRCKFRLVAVAGT